MEPQQFSIQQALDHAVQLHTSGRLVEAETFYKKVLEDAPDNYIATNLLGVIYHQVGKNDIASQLIQKAINLKPDYVEAHTNLASVFMALRRLEDAERSCRRALEFNPDHLSALINLGHALKDQGRFEDAEQNYRRLLALNNDNSVAHFCLATVLHEQGRLSDAAVGYREALAVNPNYAEAHASLGNLLREQERLDDALACYREALRINPNLEGLQSNIGNLLLQMGNADGAVASHLESLRVNPDYVAAHTNLGNAYAELGRLDDALASYEKALILSPDSAETHYYLGNLLQALERLDEAIAHYRKAIDLKLDSADTHYNLGVALFKLGRRDESVPCFKKALVVKPDFAQAYNNLGAILANQDDPDGAFATYLKALDCKPDTDAVLRTTVAGIVRLGQMLERKNLSEKAATIYGEAAKRVAKNSEYARQLDAQKQFILNQEADRLTKTTTDLFFTESDGVAVAPRIFTAMLGAMENSADTKIHELAPRGVRATSVSTVENVAQVAMPQQLDVSELFLARCRNGLISENFLTISAAGRLINEGLTSFRICPENASQVHSFFPEIIGLQEGSVLLQRRGPVRRIKEPCVLISTDLPVSTNSYYHWMVDYLPRIGLFEKSTIYQDAFFIVHQDLTSFQLESLALLGIGQDQLIKKKSEEWLLCDTLYLPAYASRTGNAHPESIAFLREKILSPLIHGEKEGPKYVYLSRRDSTNRQIANESEVEDFLQERGFEIIVPGHLSLAEQIRAVAHAEVIVLTHGAAIANLVFAPREAHVVEILTKFHTAALSITSELGQRYSYVLPEQIQSEFSKNFEHYGYNKQEFVQPLSDLSRVLDSIID